MTTAQETKWYLVSKVSQFPKHEGKRVRFQDYDIAVFNLGGGQYRAIDNQCPHKQGPLADGIVAGDNVFCPLHSMIINLGTGCALGEDGAVKTYPVMVHEEKIYVAFDEGRLTSCE